VGFVLNRPSPSNIADLLPELDNPGLVIYEGGPVQNDTLHVIHRMPDVLGGLEIAPGLFWGGSYHDLSRIIKNKAFAHDDLRLFIGYSGWEKGQLEQELKDGSWLVAERFDDLIFGTEPDRVWQDSIKSLGSAYAYLANMPLHPQLN